MPKTTALFTLTLLLATQAFACGGTSDDDGAVDAGTEASQEAAAEDGSDAAPGSEAGQDAGCEPPAWLVDFLTTYGRKACDGFAGCCTSAAMSFDADACVSAWVSLYLGKVEESACGQFTLDPAEAQACHDSVAAYAQSCDKDSPLYLKMNTPCGRAVYGSKPSGAPCSTSLDCARPEKGVARCLHWSTTDQDGGVTSGELCQHEIPAGEGEPCDDSFSHEPILRLCDSEAGFWCDTKGSGTCKAPGNPGDPCPLSAGGPGCVTTAVCNMGKCEPTAQPGESCETISCASSKGECDPTTKKCVALAAPGQPCQEKWDCASAECLGGTCAPKSDLLGWFGVPGSCSQQ